MNIFKRRVNQATPMPQKKRPINCGSCLLQQSENELLFSLLGHDCISLAAAVVRLYRADSDGWTKELTGVISLVKDYNKRAYVLRMFDIIKRTLCWEQTLYKYFQVTVKVSRFFSFEGDKAVYGLSFADESEACDFNKHLRKRFEQEIKSSNPPHISTPPLSKSNHQSNIIPGITSAGAMSHINSGIKHLEEHTKKTKRNTKKDKRQKIKKEDIGSPSNFQHKAHIGWDQDGGFSRDVFGSEPMDNSVRDLLRAAGENPDNMKADELKFAYTFINQWKSNEEQAVPVKSYHPTPPPSYQTRGVVKPESSMLQRSRPLPPVPPYNPTPTPVIPRHEQMPPARPPPPPPPVSQPVYTPSTTYSSSNSVSNASGTAAPPPPPPPPPPPIAAHNFAANAEVKQSTSSQPSSTPDTSSAPRANLLAEIQAGTRLKPVGPPSEKNNGLGKVKNSNDDVMEEIKQGAVLRHVNQDAETENRKSTASNQNPLAGALARALENRRNRMQQSDSEDGGSNDSEWEDD